MKKWEGFDTAIDVNLSRVAKVDYDNEFNLRKIAKNYGYDFKGFIGNKLLLINQNSNDKLSPKIGDYIRVMGRNLERLSKEDFESAREMYLPSSEILRRLEALEKA